MLALFSLGSLADTLAVQVGQARSEVVLDAGAFQAGPREIEAWVRRSMEIVEGYYGRFPVAVLRIGLEPVSGDRVAGGTTFATPTPHMRIRLGRAVTPGALLDDWVLVHEMIHLALPEVGEAHAWLSEGLATYVEGVARARAHNRAVEDVWAEDVRQMPKGLPGPDDEGLDHTHTWGRTYWGGALYCLLADVEIRRRTDNRRGLGDALRAILRASGGLSAQWPIERVLRVGDEAVGVPVLEELYGRMKDRAETPDLEALWRTLGIEPDGDTVRLRADAPLAAVRESITR